MNNFCINLTRSIDDPDRVDSRNGRSKCFCRLRQEHDGIFDE